MPKQDHALPVGATAVKLHHHGTDYPLDIDTHGFTRTGVDGAEKILPVFRDDNVKGEILEGMWKKGWDSDIDTFTAIVDTVNDWIELSGVAAIAGTAGQGWLNCNNVVPMMDGVEMSVSMQVPCDDTGAVASRDISQSFYLRGDIKAVDDPRGDADFLRIVVNVDESGLLMYVEKEVDGANTDLFNGSTYDDASVRATGDLEGTIWRIVFHEGHYGESSPSDGYHMHVYLKQKDTIANAESETEHELSSSPYDISDLLFRFAYPALMIDTEHATYFGSGNEGIFGYVTADYPSFDMVYDIAAANRFKGDCEVWDGDPDGSGIQVFDEDHEFSGDCYVQNGHLRIHVNDGTMLDIYYYSGAAWTALTTAIRPMLVDSSKNITYPYFKKLINISPDKIIFQVKMVDSATDDSDYYALIDITVERGKHYVKMEVIEIYPIEDFRIRIYNSSTRRFGYAGDEYIGDEDLTISGTNTTMTDNFMEAFDDDGTAVILGFASNKKPDNATAQKQAYQGGYLYFSNYNPETAVLAIFYVLCTPFSDIATMFEEAEDATSDGVETVDGAASGGKCMRLDAQNEYVYYDLTAGTDIVEGRYLAVFRAKDSNQVADDFGMYVINSTDTSYRNEENAIVTTTLAASYAYYVIVFDVTETDVDGGDNIRVYCKKMLADANDVDVDYILIIPLSDGENGPQDLAHDAMRVFSQPTRVRSR